MILNFLNCWSLIGVVGEELLKQVSALIRKVTSLYFLPIFLILALNEHIIEEFFFSGFLEGEDASDQDEEDHSC